MSEHSCVHAVVEMLDTPELRAAAESSPAVRMSLQGLFNQVNDEIAMLTPILDQRDTLNREQLAAVIEGRRVIVERLRALLFACGAFFAQATQPASRPAIAGLMRETAD